MEEYRDLHLTVAAFRHVLDEPEFLTLTAGIALQAYLPDSHAGARRHSRAWAGPRTARRRRLDQGSHREGRQPRDGAGGKRTGRLGAGAVPDQGRRRRQLQAHGRPRVRSRGHGGASACRRREPQPVRHRVGTRAARRRLARSRGRDRDARRDGARARARAVRARAGSLLLYAPVVGDDEYVAAIAYLSRRLDENAAPENFLRALFSITPGSPAWHAEHARFETAVAARATGVDGAAARSGSPHRAARVRSRRAVRERARHRLRHRREPRMDLPRTWPPTGPRPCRHSSPRPTQSTRWSRVRTRPPRNGRPRRRPTAAACSTRAAEVMAAHRGRTLAVMTYETAQNRAGRRSGSFGSDRHGTLRRSEHEHDRASRARRRAVHTPRHCARRRAVEFPLRDPGQRSRSARSRPETASCSSPRPRRSPPQSSSSPNSTRPASRPT